MGKVTTIQGVHDAVNETTAETLGVDVSTIRPESNLIDDLGGDSLDAVELVMALEEKFDIEIPEDEAESIRTVSDIYDVVAKKLHIS